MLAEELMAIARRFRIRQEPNAMTRTSSSMSCEAARVLCRLALLHDNLDYRRRAIIAPDADYRADAARVLDALADGLASTHGMPSDLSSVAIYGVARLELDFQV